ncbi:MAG: hypothetical protein AAF533_02885 [Acidobacteriota bacterium]
MDERHENEQYFFDEPTIELLADLLSGFEAPCCLCAPMVARAVAERGRTVTLLDLDERFADVPGFRHFDLTQPEWISDEFDVLLCDPPFFNVSLSRLSDTLFQLTHHDASRPVLVTYLERRESSLLGALGRFDLRPTGFLPGYRTVMECDRNAIALYSNLPSDRLAALA